jgi:hypothetical protein
MPSPRIAADLIAAMAGRVSGVDDVLEVEVSRLALVVPTYWSRPGGARQPGDAVYDHPNAVDSENRDLERLLESLTRLDEQPDCVLILVAVTAPEVAEPAEARVSAALQRFPSLRTLQFGERGLRRIHDRLTAHGLEACQDFLRLEGYARVRNLQLVVPHVLGYDLVVALDDDEVVEDASYLTRVRRHAGASFDGRKAAGLGGFYLDASGSNRLRVTPEEAHSPNVFVRKLAIMNACTEWIEAQPGQVVPTSFVLGGNMAFTRPLFERVGFDPSITRGEDIDYLINARLEGMWFFLDKRLNIVHLPPSGGSYKDFSYSKLHQDVVRFLYERQKLQAAAAQPGLEPVSAEMLAPYPGDLLVDDLEDQALQALRDLRPADDRGWPQPKKILDQACRHAAEGVPRYFEFRRAWPEMMAALGDDETLKRQLSDHLGWDGQRRA